MDYRARHRMWIVQKLYYDRGETSLPPCDDVLCGSKVFECNHRQKLLPSMDYVPEGWELCTSGCGFVHRLDDRRPVVHSQDWLMNEYVGMRRIMAHMRIKLVTNQMVLKLVNEVILPTIDEAVDEVLSKSSSP